MQLVTVVLTFVGVFAGLTHARAQTEIRIAIHLEETPCSGSIIECPLDSAVFGDHGAINLSDASGKLNIPAQIGPPKLNANTPQGKSVLTFIVPQSFPDGEELELVGRKVDAPTETFAWSDSPQQFRELTFGKRPVLRYVYEPRDTSSPARIDETFKAYHHWYDPSGEFLVTKGTGGLYPHHRGISFAFNGISYGDKQADVWHCRDGEYQSHEAFIREDVGPVYGRHQVRIDWRGRDGAIFASETRELTAYAVEAGNLVEFRSRLTTELPQVRLAGDPQHAGFQFRAAQEVADVTKGETYYLRPDGKDQPGQFRNWSAAANESEINRKHIDLSWNALSFVLNGRRFTCCYLDHPANPKPARFSERDYGRFGSDFQFELTPQRPLDVSYRLWLCQGEMTVDQVDGLSHDFVHPAAAHVIHP